MKWRKLPQQTRTPPAAAPDSLLLDTSHAAALLGVSASTFHHLAPAGQSIFFPLKSR